MGALQQTWGGRDLFEGRAVEFLSALSSGLMPTSRLSQCWALRNGGLCFGYVNS